MGFQVELSTAAARAFVKLPPQTQHRLTPKIDALRQHPRPPGCEKLAGLDAYRIRVGDYRVVYLIDDSREIITIAKIGHRRDVHRRI